MPETRKYVDYTGLTQYDSKLKKWVIDRIKDQKTDSKNADWSENNVSSPSYIKNRTHYKEPEYWTFSEGSSHYGYYSLNTDYNELSPETFIYEVSVDGGEFIDVCPSVNSKLNWFSFGNPEYNPEPVDPIFKKAVESVGTEDVNFSITVPSSERIIFSTDDNNSHTVRIKSTERKVPFFENHYVFMNGEINLPDDYFLEENQIYDVDVDNETIPLTLHKIRMSSDSQAQDLEGFVLGNGELVDSGYSIIMAVQGENMESEYDASIDSDAPIGIIIFKPSEDFDGYIGLIFSNVRNISSVYMEGMEEPLSVQMVNLYDYMGQDAPSSEIDYTFETEPAGYRGKILSITENSDEGMKVIRDFIDDREPLIVTFNGEVYEIPFTDGGRWPSVYYDATIVSGTKDWGEYYLLGDETTPFQVFGPINANNNYPIFEVIFKDDYDNQNVSIKVDYESGSIVHKLNKEYIPNPTWTEVEDKPDWASKKDIISIFWPDSSHLFEIYGNTLYWAEDVDESTIDYPIIIPASINGKKVENLDISLYETQCTGLFFEEGLPTTGSIAQNRTTIKEAYIYADEIPSYSFRSCTGLEEVEIGDNVASIGAYAFLDCSNLKKANLPSSITYLPEGMFSGCNLSSITIPKTVTSSSGSFLYNNNGDCKVTLEYGMTEVPNSLLYFSSVKSVSIPDTVTSIGSSAFNQCTVEYVNIPESVTSIGTYSFAYSGIHEMTLPEGVTYIPNYSFRYCSQLEEFHMGESVTSIGNSAFQDCSSLTTIDLPDSITYMGESVFRDCTSLTSITYPAISEVKNSTFYGCSSLTDVTIPDTVTSIGSYAFQDCTSLVSIELPNSVRTLSTYTFSGCTSLESITLPSSMTSLGSQAFGNCTSLTSIDIPNVSTIPSYTFASCTSLTEVTIPNTVTSIGSGAFSSCTSLGNVTLPSALTSIGQSAFYMCSGITEITIPSSVTSIGSQAFRGTSITSIVLPNSIQYLDCVNYCTSLKNLTLGNNVRSMSGINTLTSLESLTISNTTPPTFTQTAPSTLSAIYVPEELVNTYKSTTGWSRFASIIQAIQ